MCNTKLLLLLIQVVFIRYIGRRRKFLLSSLHRLAHSVPSCTLSVALILSVQALRRATENRLWRSPKIGSRVVYFTGGNTKKKCDQFVRFEGYERAGPPHRSDYLSLYLLSDNKFCCFVSMKYRKQVLRIAYILREILKT